MGHALLQLLYEIIWEFGVQSRTEIAESKVKIPDNDNIKELMLEAKHKKWLAEVNTRMKKLGFN